MKNYEYEHQCETAVQLATNIEDSMSCGYVLWSSLAEDLIEGIDVRFTNGKAPVVCYPFEAFKIDEAVEVALNLVGAVTTDVLKVMNN